MVFAFARRPSCLLVYVLISLIIFFIVLHNATLISLRENPQPSESDANVPKVIERVVEKVVERVKVVEKVKIVDMNQAEVFTVPADVVVHQPGSETYNQHAKTMNTQCGNTMGVRRHLENYCPKIPYDYKNFDGRNHSIEEYWPNFSPSRQDFLKRKEIDFREYVKTEEWKKFMECSKTCKEAEFDKMKHELNKRFPVLNADKFPNVFDKKFVPLMAMAYKRREPFATVVSEMGKALDIDQTILIVSVDGNGFEEIIDVVLNIKFMRVYVFFHAFTIDYKNLAIPVDSGDCFRNNLNLVHGARLSLETFGQDYFALVADDVKPMPDFYVFLQQVAPYVVKNHETVLAVESYAAGPGTDCNYIATRLTNTGICNQYTYNNVIAEEWWTGYFGGFTMPRLIEILEVGKRENYKNCYDLWIVCLNTIKQLKSIMPCKHRAVYIPNVGIHGVANARWDHPLPVTSQASWDYQNYYVVDPKTNRREKIIPIEDPNK